MKKEKFHIEYVFDSASKNSLWNHLAIPSGLSEWFADNVTVRDNVYIFSWNGTSVEAEVLTMIQNSCVRFRWVDEEDPKVYFEFKLHDIELTGGIMLEITDFAEKDEKGESISLWGSQVRVLTRMLGL